MNLLNVKTKSNAETKSYKTITQFIASILLFSFLSGCTIFGSSSDSDSKPSRSSVSIDSQQTDYNRASRKLRANRFEEALASYTEFIIKYPFGSLSERARLERIFILDKLNEPEQASVAVDQFITQYPLHPNIDYAYYMRGVVVFEKKRSGFLKRFAGAKQQLRNKSKYQQSHEAFAELIQKYPNSQYAEDAKERILYLRNNMAIYELSVANFYAERNAHIGAIKRAEYIVQNFDQAPAVIDALKLMAKSYDKIGLKNKAQETRNLLETNYRDISGVQKVSKRKKRAWLRLPNLNPFKRSKNS